MISRRFFFWLILLLMPFAIAACSSTSSSLGLIHEGRILMLTVLQMDRTEELRYSTIDQFDVVRRWRMQPSNDGLELLLMRFKVENHVAVNAIFVADEQAAVIRGFFQDDYRPLSVTDTVYLDARGQTDAVVTMDGGKCTDHAKLVVNAGTNVRWTNDGDAGSAIEFAPGVLPGFGDGLSAIAPGASISHRFDQTGAFVYRCSGGTNYPIASIADAGDGDILVTTSGSHGLVAGDDISQTGLTGSSYSGNYEIKTVPSATTYTVAGPFTATDTGTLVIGPSQLAQVLVEDADSIRGEKDNNILFLEGAFELPRGTAVDGWMIFEVPVDAKIRDLRWRAGGSITIRF